ncbi:MAG: FkbM family methyltransferase [Deltaproteobacteria bacterium]|nr:FkbM family methyltransferase [Deltaproteobacteria bacterium]
MSNAIEQERRGYFEGDMEKPEYIKEMYRKWHSTLFEYSESLALTNIRKIEIEAGQVVVTTRDRGIRLACIPGDYRIAPIHILNFYDHEKDESQMIEKLVDDEATVFDVGANIGWYSINLAVSRRNSKIYAFEPIPRTYSYLEKNVGLNGLTNVFPQNFGFSKEAGEVPFYYYPEGSGNASMANLTGRTDLETVTSQLRTLDSFAKEMGATVDFIKCDVEGAELFVFQGALETLQTQQPVIATEMLRKWAAKYDYHPNKIISLLSELGYSCFTTDGQHLFPFKIMDESTVETNFFFLHEDKHVDIINLYTSL